MSAAWAASDAALIKSCANADTLDRQRVGLDWGKYEVDRTLRISVGVLDLVAPEGSDEDDRSQLRLLTLPDESRRLESVHVRHADV